MNISMLGSGYVGLVAGVCFADAGHRMTCVDSNDEKIRLLSDGQLPFYEPGLNDLYQRNRKRMTFTQDIDKATKESEVIFIAVGTPELPDGSADLEPTLAVLKSVCEAADAPKVVVLKSTVPIGTFNIASDFCKEHSKFPIEVVNNPEFLRQGSAVDDFLRPARVVIGCQTEQAQKLMRELYEPFLKNNNPIIFMDNVSAEMTKYAANSFLAMKISFINELALLADKLGANINDVRKGFSSDRRINPTFFSPGIGYGGSCFPKDVRALVHTGKAQGLDLLMLEATDDVNERQKTIMSHRLLDRFGSLEGMNVTIWGLSFKPHTDDVRRAPSVALIDDLNSRGANVTAYDPVATDNARSACKTEFKTTDSAIEAAKGADALILVTEWNEFKSANLSELKSVMKSPVIFDGRNVFPPKKMKAEGFEYHCIGFNMSNNG